MFKNYSKKMNLLNNKQRERNFSFDEKTKISFIYPKNKFINKTSRMSTHKFSMLERKYFQDCRSVKRLKGGIVNLYVIVKTIESF